MTSMSDKQRDELERLVDTHGLTAVLEAIATICYLKAQHVREDWQDKHTARPWQTLANRLDKLSSRSHSEGL